MSKILLPFHTDDISAFARAMCRQLAARTDVPSHLEMLNILARAAGFQNFQSYRELAIHQQDAANDANASQVALTANAKKLISYLDDSGRLTRWPNKYTVQQLSIWYLWTLFIPRHKYTEREVNEVLKAFNTFGDHVILRRELVNAGLLWRTPDGAQYRKQPSKPSDEVMTMIREIRRLRKLPKARKVA
ncbi:DUF2087 domain-containing protein [Chitinivorax sp. B]|uniref:DUF2087 domain-containing protein n=1 Tax=Chitinivorax sp. B TaxID=2502235 RepID=UPI0014857BB8|nr:DUF2087 domain-containing protein [Chitinivorax sp. B]